MRVCHGLLLTFLVACGSDATSSSGGNPPPPPPPPPAAPVADVSMTDNGGLAPYAFSPPTLTVTVGTTVRWTNNGKALHTATSDATPVWNSGTVGPAGTTTCPSPPNPLYPCTPVPTPPGTYQRTFDAPGTYPYHCEFHGLLGGTMTGTITVTSP